jgi:hypothetical protein
MENFPFILIMLLQRISLDFTLFMQFRINSIPYENGGELHFKNQKSEISGKESGACFTFLSSISLALLRVSQQHYPAVYGMEEI